MSMVIYHSTTWQRDPSFIISLISASKEPLGLYFLFVFQMETWIQTLLLSVSLVLLPKMSALALVLLYGRSKITRDQKVKCRTCWKSFYKSHPIKGFHELHPSKMPRTFAFIRLSISAQWMWLHLSWILNNNKQKTLNQFRTSNAYASQG